MITPEEAFLVLDKLRSERVTVAFLGALYGWSFSCKGRITALSRREFTLTSLDEMAAFDIELTRPDLEFEYFEPGHMPLPERSTVPDVALRAASLGILLPRRFTPEQVLADAVVKRERFFVIEIPEGAE